MNTLQESQRMLEFLKKEIGGELYDQILTALPAMDDETLQNMHEELVKLADQKIANAEKKQDLLQRINGIKSAYEKHEKRAAQAQVEAADQAAVDAEADALLAQLK